MQKNQITIEEYKRLAKRLPGARKQQASKAKTKLYDLVLFYRNQGVKAELEYMFHPERKWRFDVAFPDHMVAVEYEGIFSTKSRHTSVKGYTEDANKYNEAQALGWKVIRVTALNIDTLGKTLSKLI